MKKIKNYMRYSKSVQIKIYRYKLEKNQKNLEYLKLTKYIEIKLGA